MNTKTIPASALFLAIVTASSLLALGETQNPVSPPAPTVNQKPSSAPGQAGQAPAAPAQNPSGAPDAQQARSQQPPAAIRATTRLVQVSVVVHDKHGDPIADLTKEDFVILDEKRRQEIRLFSMETNRMPEHAPPQLPPNTYTNRIQERGNVPTSITVLLFDGLNTQITDQAYARQQVVKFIQKQLQPQDRVAIYSLGHDLRILHDFSNDAASLLAALGAYKGQDTPQLDASEAQISDNPNAAIAAFLNNAYQYEANFFVTDRVHRTVEALTAIANHVGTLPGRKNLIWISGSFPFSIGYENIERSTSDARELYANDIETAARALTNANLAVYPVDARGLMTFDLENRTTSSNPRGGTMGIISNSAQNRDLRFKGPATSTFDSMNVLADRTGGKAFYNRNDIWGSVREAIDDSRVTYELGYYPQGVDWNGSFHEIKVEVRRPGAHVRARKGYFALPEPKLTPQIRQAIIAQSATSSLEPTGIGVQVRVQPNAGERKLHTVASFDLREFALEQRGGRWTGAIDTVFIQLDNRNQIITAIDETYHLNLDLAKYEQLLKEGVTITKDVAILPNAVEMRVVLRDGTTGTVGAVGVPLAKYFPAQSSSAN
jgi:VWFA-related protein